jgi:hypothetical protein
MIRDMLAEVHDEMIVADGFDEALIGYVERIGSETVALYDRDKCILILERYGMTDEEAVEYFEFNVIGSYVGKFTPAFATIIKIDEVK